MAISQSKIVGFLRNITNEDIRFHLLVRVARWLYPGYRLTWPYLKWWADPWFNEYLDRFGELEKMNTHRRWEQYQLMRLIDAVPGDTAECGAYKGAGSYLICEMNRRQSAHSRWHHVFDSFDGLSAPGARDGEHWRRGSLRATEDELRRNLSEFSRYSLYKGWIPGRFADVANRRFAFVHVDVDLYEPTRDSIEFFYPRLNPGGILLCDDYGCTTCPGATEAIDKYLAGKPEPFIALAAGGGYMIKRSAD